MVFVFLCSKCGSVLYEDPRPLLRDDSYKHQTYLERVLEKIGSRCPRCGHRLRIPPLRIEVFASRAIQEAQMADLR
jgi:DNA-directed RNA polymerase subunit RPC12/RpoP